MSPRRSAYETLLSERSIPWVAGLLFLVVGAFWHGRVWPLLPDGSHYLAIGREMVLRHRLADPIGFVGHPAPSEALHWPPLYPIGVATLGAFGVPWVTAGRLLSLVGVLAAVVVFARLIAARTAGPGRLAGVAWIVLTPALCWQAELVASEGLAVGLVALTFLFLDRARSELSPRAGFALGLAAGLTVATRWSCVVLGLPVAWAMARELRASRPKAVPWALAVSAGALAVLLPLAYWRLRVGDAPRGASSYTLVPLARDAAVGIAKAWGLNTLGAGLLPALLTVALAGSEEPPAALARARDGALTEHLLFIAGLVAMQLVMAMRYRLDSIGGRLLFPATPSLVMVMVLLAGGARGALRGARVSRFSPAAAVGAVLLAAALHVAFMRRWAAQRMQRGAYAALLPALDRVAAGSEVFTDVPELISQRLDLRWTRLQVEPNGDAIGVGAAHLQCGTNSDWWLSAAPEALRAAPQPGSTCAAGACLRPLPCGAAESTVEARRP